MLVPTLFPVATSLGIDPILRLVVTLNICIGMITPPFAGSVCRLRHAQAVGGGRHRRHLALYRKVNVAVLAIISYIRSHGAAETATVIMQIGSSPSCRTAPQSLFPAAERKRPVLRNDWSMRYKLLFSGPARR